LKQGKVTTFSGGFRGSRDGTTKTALYNVPTYLCFDYFGNLILTEYGRIRKICNVIPAFKTKYITDCRAIINQTKLSNVTIIISSNQRHYLLHSEILSIRATALLFF